MSLRKFFFVSFIFFCVNVKVFAQRLSGDTVITAIDSIYNVGNHHFNSVYYFHTHGKWGILDYKKKTFLAADYDTLILLHFSRDYAGFMARKNGKYGIVDDYLKMTDFIYDTLCAQYSSTNGNLYYFVSRKKDKYGIIDYTGKMIVPFSYDYESSMMGEFDMPFSIMVNKQEVYNVNTKRLLLFCFQINDSLQAWGFDKRYGVILQHTKNDSLFPVTGSWSDDGNFYTAYFKKDTVYRQHNGEGITLPMWAKNVNLSYGPTHGESYYFVETNSGHFGVMNEKFHLITDTIYRNYCMSPLELPDRKTIFYFMQKAVPGKTPFDFEGDWVITNTKGKQINDLTFYKPYYFLYDLAFYTEGAYMCSGDGKWGKLNKQLKWSVQPQFDTMWTLFWDTLNDQTSFMVKKDGKYGILDSGKVVVPFNYTRAIFGFGGGFVILINEKETLAYEPFTKSLVNLDSLLLKQYKTNVMYSYYYSHNYKYTNGQYTPHLLTLTEQKIIRSRFLMDKIAYQIRFTNGENFSPLLYSPGVYSYRDKEYFPEPFYPPKPTYVPWFHYLSSCSDSDFFSFAYYYNTYDHYMGGYSNIIIPLYSNNSTIFHYSFSKQDSISYINYLVVGDTCHPITLDSIFRKDASVEQELKRIFLEDVKKHNINLPKGDWILYDRFYITQNGLTLNFRCSEKDKKGNTQIYGMNFPWSTISTLIDPKGPFRNKILKESKAKK